MLRELVVETKRLPTALVPKEAYEEFAKLAKKEGISFSQALREAMQEYARSRGVEIKLDVPQWGGSRKNEDEE